MSRGPGVHEIFSNQALGATNAFKFENQESKQQFKLSKKNTLAPLPPMKNLGGYKPKILAENSSDLEIPNSTQGAQEALTLNAKTRPAPLPEETSRPRPQLTKPKAWVIGDKNVPMVLGFTDSLEDEDSDKSNGISHSTSESDIYNRVIHNGRDNHFNDIESMRTQSTSSDTSTLIPDHAVEPKRGIENPVHSVYNSPLGEDDNSPTQVSDAISGNSHFSCPRANHQDYIEESDSVFIPAPDYDEEEQTLEFNSEDTDEANEGGNSKVPRAQPVIKAYEGADLSHYLSDDDVDLVKTELRGEGKLNKNVMDRKSKTVGQKSSLFKQNKRKSVGPEFNSVRSFSYADSKFGTKEKSTSKSLSFTELTDDSDMFLSTNNRHSSYESFLRSRHGETMPPESNDNGLDKRLDRVNSQEQHKRDSVWKKLTLRVKNRGSRGSSGKEP